MRVTKISVLISLLVLLGGCASREPLYHLEVTNCDPMHQEGCVSLTTEVFEGLMEIYDDYWRMRAAYNTCKNGV